MNPLHNNRLSPFASTPSDGASAHAPQPTAAAPAYPKTLPLASISDTTMNWLKHIASQGDVDQAFIASSVHVGLMDGTLKCKGADTHHGARINYAQRCYIGPGEGNGILLAKAVKNAQGEYDLPEIGLKWDSGKAMKFPLAANFAAACQTALPPASQPPQGEDAAVHSEVIAPAATPVSAPLRTPLPSRPLHAQPSPVRNAPAQPSSSRNAPAQASSSRSAPAQRSTRGREASDDELMRYVQTDRGLKSATAAAKDIRAAGIPVSERHLRELIKASGASVRPRRAIAPDEDVMPYLKDDNDKVKTVDKAVADIRAAGMGCDRAHIQALLRQVAGKEKRDKLPPLTDDAVLPHLYTEGGGIKTTGQAFNDIHAAGFGIDRHRLHGLITAQGGASVAGVAPSTRRQSAAAVPSSASSPRAADVPPAASPPNAAPSASRPRAADATPSASRRKRPAEPAADGAPRKRGFAPSATDEMLRQHFRKPDDSVKSFRAAAADIRAAGLAVDEKRLKNLLRDEKGVEKRASTVSDRQFASDDTLREYLRTDKGDIKSFPRAVEDIRAAGFSVDDKRAKRLLREERGDA